MKAGPIFISAGEASGDVYGARLARELKRRRPGLGICGFGGARMAAAGVDVDESLGKCAVVGWTGVVRHLRLFVSLLRGLRRRWTVRRPGAVVLVDFPGFNLRLGSIAHSLGIPVYYYVCPQVWAWGAGRLMLMRKILRRAFLILPFEEALYQSFGMRASFVGHPLLEIVPSVRPSGTAALKRAGLDSRRPLVVLLPGSRADEISRHLPLFLGVAGKLAAERRDLTWAVVTAPGMDDSVEACLRGASGFEVRAVHDPDYAIRALAALALTASGTSTLELGLLGVPEIVAYRGNWLNWMIARRLVRVPHVGLVNLILGRREVPELLQAAASPRALVDLSRRLLRGREAMVRARICARELRTALEPPRPPSASAVVAQDLLSDLAGFAG